MALRYKLRTLLILLAILPPLLGVAWVKYSAWRAEQARREWLRLIPNGFVVELVWVDDLAVLPISPTTAPRCESPMEAPPVTVPEEPRE